MAISPGLVHQVQPLFAQIISKFPQQYFRYGFAYGSGVFKQMGKSKATPMVDMIFVVDDTDGFHGQNVLLNPKHYSSLKYWGHSFLSKVQSLPAGIYYNTLVSLPEENITLKYGIVSRQDFINDLLDWNYLYLAGRMHKPTLVVIPTFNEDLLTAIRMNLVSALHAAFLILPQYFTERDLYRTIVKLSYHGDFRMVFGEDKNKIDNIVNAQVNHLRTLYTDLLPHFDNYVEIPNGDSVDQTCIQDVSPTTKMFHLYQLPKVPQQAIVKYWRHHIWYGGIRHDTEDVLRALSNHPDIADIVSKCLRNIVFSSSLQQSIKGIFTAGLVKSVVYSSKKINKMIQSQKVGSTS